MTGLAQSTSLHLPNVSFGGKKKGRAPWRSYYLRVSYLPASGRAGTRHSGGAADEMQPIEGCPKIGDLGRQVLGLIRVHGAGDQ